MVVNLLELLQKIMLLTSNVEGLRSDVNKMNTLLMDHHDRIVRLETSGDLVAEKAKNAAFAGANLLTSNLAKELYELRARVYGSTVQDQNLLEDRGKQKPNSRPEES